MQEEEVSVWPVHLKYLSLMLSMMCAPAVVSNVDLCIVSVVHTQVMQVGTKPGLKDT